MKKVYYWVCVFLASQTLALANSADSSEDVVGLRDKKNPCPGGRCDTRRASEMRTPRALEDGGFSVGASFLYQQAIMDNLSSTRKVEITGTSETRITVDERIDNVDYKWRPGVKVEAGYIFSQREQLALNIAWTHLRGRGTSSISFDDPTLANGDLGPLWIPFITGPFADKGSSKWDCKLNLLDGVFGKRLFLGKWFAMRPYAGVRGAWINQDYLAKYHGAWQLFDGSGVSLDFRDTSFKVTNDFKGVGLLFGLENDYYIAHNFSAFTNLTASLLYGRFNAMETADGQIVITPLPNPSVAIPETVILNRDFHRVRPNIEGEIGLRWEKFFSGNSSRFFIGASYQFSFWFFQNITDNVILYFDEIQNSYASSNVEYRNLQFHGIRIQAGFDF